MKDYFQFPNHSPAYAVIWMHGLGASSEDMQGLVTLMDLQEVFVRHVFLDAPKRPVSINNGMVMPAWYDITGLDLSNRDDVVGLEASRVLIDKVVKTLVDSGFSMNQIILAGFSQGAAMALYSALHYAQSFAGVVALSGYLPAPPPNPTLPRETPFFLGYGRYDAVVMPAWTQATVQRLQQYDYQQIVVESYPMEHSVCSEELQSLSQWIKALAGEKK